MKVKVKKFNPNGYVSRAAFEQVRWEKDVAMQQLEELGVPFAAKVELYAKPIMHAHWDMENLKRVMCSYCKNYPPYDYFGRYMLSKFCPHCGAQMDEEVIK